MFFHVYVAVTTKRQIIFPFSEITIQNNGNKPFGRENREIWRLVVTATIVHKVLESSKNQKEQSWSHYYYEIRTWINFRTFEPYFETDLQVSSEQQ